MQAMRIPVEVTGVNAAVNEFEKVAEAGRRAAQAGQNINAGGGGAGPQARFRAAQAAFDANPGDFDTTYRFRQAQRSLQRAERVVNNERRDPLMDLIGTTRLNLGPVSPLVNRMNAAVPGMGIALGAAGLLKESFEIAARAARAVGEAFGSAAGIVTQLSAARTLSGGTTGQVSQLGSFGLSGGQITGLSSSLRERLTSDPLAMMAGAQVGLSPQLGRAFGGQNEAGLLLKAIEGLRGIKDAEEQLRVARLLGLESTLELARVSDRVFAGMKRDAVVRRTLFDDQTLQSARDFAGEATRVSSALDNLRVSLIRAAIQPSANGLGDTADALNGIAGIAGPAAKGLGDIFNFLNPLGNIPGAIFGATAKAGRALGQTPEQQAQERNTEALMDLNRLLKQMVGGGPRAEAALPSGLRGNWQALNAAAQGALSKGAWKA